MERQRLTYQDINIIFEDNHLLVAFKPQNLASCPDETGDENLLELLKEYLIAKYDKKGQAFLGLVHRLDRPTGGVMVFAKTSKGAARLAESMANGSFEKKYYAITLGVPREKSAELKNALYKNLEKNEVYCVPMATEGAKMAILNYRVLQERDELALVEIKLITGRSHQARVQMAHIGTPIFGDQKYGGTKMPKNQNLCLWAVEIRFPHPVTKEMMVFRVQPPEEISPWKAFVIPTIM